MAASANDYIQAAQNEGLLDTLRRDGPELVNRLSPNLGKIWEQLDPAQQREVIDLASRG
jgi:hypothetical protein